jgi:hypothetical protein
MKKLRNIHSIECNNTDINYIPIITIKNFKYFDSIRILIVSNNNITNIDII